MSLQNKTKQNMEYAETEKKNVDWTFDKKQLVDNHHSVGKYKRQTRKRKNQKTIYEASDERHRNRNIKRAKKKYRRQEKMKKDINNHLNLNKTSD